MARYWSKALFYKDFKTCLWVMAGLTVLLVIHPLTSIISELNRIKGIKEILLINEIAPADWGDWFGHVLVAEGSRWLLILLFVVLGLVQCQFHDLRREAIGDWLAGMPFTRRQLIFTQWVMGVLAIAVPFLVIFVLLSVFYLVQREWITTSYWLIPQWALLHGLFFACFYSFLFFVQSVMGHHVAAGIVGTICTMVPWYLCVTVPVVLEKLFGLSSLSSIQDIGELLFWPHWLEGRSEYLPPDWTNFRYIYTHYWLKVLIMGAILIGFYWLAERAYARNPLEKNGQLLMFGFLEPVLIWGFALCFGLLISLMTGLGFNGDSATLVLGLAAGMAAGYWMAKKVVSYYQR